MPYEFSESIATADIAFDAWGASLGELFCAAADATMNVMVEELGSILPVEVRRFTLQNDRLDMLLFNFLQELIYFKDAQLLLLRVFDLRILQEPPGFVLTAVARGEAIDPTRHRLRVDVKAVTLHRFYLENTDRGWEALVILDI